MQELDKEFVEYVVRALVDHPEAVHVRRTEDEMGTLLELTVSPEDMGKVIGKAGATAKSLRTLLRVLGSRSDSRVNLKIIEPVTAADESHSTLPTAPQALNEGESESISRHRSDVEELQNDFDH
jgi:predicted RNA-binding protein YlqC (UPF0109 family)